MSIDKYKKPSYWKGLINSLQPYGDEELIKGIISKINHVEAFTKAKNNDVLDSVNQQRELLGFIKEVSEWDKDYSSTRLKLKAKELLKSNCG